LKKIDITINKKPSIAVPLDVNNQDRSNQSFLELYRCRSCDNLVDLFHKDKEGKAFKSKPPVCPICQTKDNYENIAFYSNNFIISNKK
jgi:rubrerythrin